MYFTEPKGSGIIDLISALGYTYHPIANLLTWFLYIKSIEQAK